MKKIYCDAAPKDFLGVSLSAKSEFSGAVILYAKDNSDDESVAIRLSPEKIRKLRKQLKKALLQIEGVKEDEA